jgi:hypothetical protein
MRLLLGDAQRVRLPFLPALSLAGLRPSKRCSTLTLRAESVARTYPIKVQLVAFHLIDKTA